MMRVELRLAGLEMSTYGTKLLNDILEGMLRVTELSEKQVNAVMDAWRERKRPDHNKGDEFYPKVTPAITKDEVENGQYTQEERDRNYVELIVKYLQTIIP